MTKSKLPASATVTPDMTVLDVVSKYRTTENVFKSYDQHAGECICCNALFERLDKIATRYGIDLSILLIELEANIEESLTSDS